MAQMSPEELAPLIAEGVRAAVVNAQRLGLIWQMRLATVEDGANPDAVSATYDGDSEPITMFSMIGSLLATTRVYVIQVPPAGNYIAGIVDKTVPSLRLRRSTVNLPGSTFPFISWDIDDERVGGSWIAVPGDTIVVPEDGWYSATVLYLGSAGDVNSQQYVTISVTSSLEPVSANYINSYSAGVGGTTCSVTRPYTAGDTIQSVVTQNSFVNMDYTAYFTMYKIGQLNI